MRPLGISFATILNDTAKRTTVGKTPVKVGNSHSEAALWRHIYLNWRTDHSNLGYFTVMMRTNPHPIIFGKSLEIHISFGSSRMNAPLSTYYLLLLELKLRRVSGNDFQKFFSDIMEAKHGDDFVRIKPYGSLGDKDCDGYLASTGSVYACYGAQNGVLRAVPSFRTKMASDFEKASSNLSDIMTRWYMVHNIVEGLPAEAILELKSLKQQNPSVEFSLFGLPSMAETMAGFPESELERFLGRSARNEDFRNFQISAVKELVDEIVSETSEHKPITGEITPVSSEKIDYNEIPGTWVAALQGGRLNEHHIQRYFEQHQVPTRGEVLAMIFRNRYSELVAEKLPPASIMYWLYVLIVGQEEVEVLRQVAAHTLLAYLFERCEIFENAGEGSQA